MLKNITTKSLLALIAAGIIVGCNKDDDAALNKCFVTNISFGGTDEIKFEYTEDNKVSKAFSSFTDKGTTTTETSTVSYDAKGNITKLQSSNGNNSTYAYNDNNQLIRVDEFDGAALDGRTEYEYNASGQLAKIQFYEINSTGAPEKDSYRSFEYPSTSSKNPSKSKSYFNDGTLYGISEYEYDDKKTFYSATGLGISFSEVAAEENNVTKQIHKDEAGVVSLIITYVYEYNDKGYPTKASYTYDFVGQSKNDSETAIYTYNCK